MPPPIVRQKKTILFVCLPWHLFLLRYGCLLSSYPSWHAPSGSSSGFPVWVVCHFSRTIPLKEPQQEPQNRFSPLPTTKPCPLTFDPWSHCVLYWLSTSWWGLGLARASLLYASKICLLLMRLPRLVCRVCRPFLTIFWFLFTLWLALFEVRPCLMVGFTFSSAHPFSCYYLLPYHSIVPIAKLCYFKLGGPLWACRLFFPYWPNKAIGSNVTLLAGSHVPFVFPWASLVLFLSLHCHGLLMNSLGFLGPITLFLILRVHGLAINPLLSLLSLLWACRDPFSLFHIIYCPWFAFFSLFELF